MGGCALSGKEFHKMAAQQSKEEIQWVQQTQGRDYLILSHCQKLCQKPKYNGPELFPVSLLCLQ